MMAPIQEHNEVAMQCIKANLANLLWRLTITLENLKMTHNCRKIQMISKIAATIVDTCQQGIESLFSSRLEEITPSLAVMNCKGVLNN